MPPQGPYQLSRVVAMLLCFLAYPVIVGPPVGELCGSVWHELEHYPPDGILDIVKLSVKMFLPIYGAWALNRFLVAWFQVVRGNSNAQSADSG